jgi:prophage regulatory protein
VVVGQIPVVGNLEGEMMLQPIAVDRKTAASFVLLSESTIDTLVRSGDFPKPRQVSPKRVVFLVRELTEWLESRPVSDILPPVNSGYGRAGKP